MNSKQVKFWTEHCIHSTYGARNGKEFYAEVLDENEKEILTKCYEGQEMRLDPTWLRKCLIGSLYEIVDKPSKFRQKNKQLSIFDL